MKLQGDMQTMERSGMQANHMGIADGGKAWSILLDKIYTNIRLAIPREMIANAVDSHKKAGREDVPMKITLPSKWDGNTIKFRDYGTSMSHEIFSTVFVILTASTKDVADDETGGWGIGSKTVFGYVHDMILNCYLDGVVRTYALYRSETGGVDWTPMGEKPTDEEDGCEFSFNVKPEDFSVFESNIRKAALWLDTVPIIENGKEISENVFEPSKFEGFVNRIGAHHNVDGVKEWVKMGCIAYPFEGDKIYPVEGQTTLDEVEKARKVAQLLSSQVFMEVPIGAVDITAPRDSLNYTDKTCAYLTEALLKTYHSATKDFGVELDKCKTLSEAMALRHSLKRETGLNVLVDEYFSDAKFNGETIPDYIRINMHKMDPVSYNQKERFEGLKVFSFHTSTRGRKSIHFHKKKDHPFLSYSEKVLVVLDQFDSKTGKYTPYRNMRMAELVDNTDAQRIVWVQFSNEDMGVFKAYMDEIGNPPYVNLNSIELKKTETKPKGRNRTLYRWFPVSNPKAGVKVEEWSTIEEILEDGEFMVINTHHSTPVGYPISTWDALKYMSEEVSKCGATLDDTPVIMISKSKEEKLGKYLKNKTDYYEYLAGCLLECFDVKQYAFLKSTFDIPYSFQFFRELENIRKVADDYSNSDGTIWLDIPHADKYCKLFDEISEMSESFRLMQYRIQNMKKYMSEDNLKELSKRIEKETALLKGVIKLSDLSKIDKEWGDKYGWILDQQGAAYREAINQALKKKG